MLKLKKKRIEEDQKSGRINEETGLQESSWSKNKMMLMTRCPCISGDPKNWSPRGVGLCANPAKFRVPEEMIFRIKEGHLGDWKLWTESLGYICSDSTYTQIRLVVVCRRSGDVAIMLYMQVRKEKRELYTWIQAEPIESYYIILVSLLSVISVFWKAHAYFVVSNISMKVMVTVNY